MNVLYILVLTFLGCGALLTIVGTLVFAYDQRSERRYQEALKQDHVRSITPDEYPDFFKEH